MPGFTTTHYFKILTFITLFFKALSFNPIPLFSFANFEKDPKFKSNVALYGNAKVVNGESKVHVSESGRVIYKKPIKLFEGKSKQLLSFSTYFAFSISLENGGGGLAFIMVPKNGSNSKGDVFNQSSYGFLPFGLSNRDFEVEFSTSRNGTRNGIFTNFNLGNSVSGKITNLGLKSDEKLHAWIDYEASSRRLEVRLSQKGKKSRPFDPILWHKIDLYNVLKEKEMFVGFSLMKGNVFLYSWSFVLRHFVPHSMMHSEPLDPFVKNTEALPTRVKKERSDCVLRVLAAMIFGTGCGALTAFIVLYLWTIFGSKRASVVPEEFVMKPLDVEYRNVKIVVDNKTTGDGK